MLEQPVHYEFYTKRTGAKIEFESRLELHEAVEMLRVLPSNDFKDALLMNYAITGGKPSESTRNWIIKLAQETLTGPVEGVEPPGDFQNVVHFVNALGVKRLYLPSLRLSKAGEGSRNPGAIYMYFCSKYIGKITKAGNLVFEQDAYTCRRVAAECSINALIEDPFQGLNDNYLVLERCPFDVGSQPVFPDQPSLHFSKEGLKKAVGAEIVEAVAKSKDPLGTLKELFKYLPEQKQVEAPKLEANKEFESGSPESSIFNALKNL